MAARADYPARRVRIDLGEIRGLISFERWSGQRGLGVSTVLKLTTR